MNWVVGGGVPRRVRCQQGRHAEKGRYQLAGMGGMADWLARRALGSTKGREKWAKSGILDNTLPSKIRIWKRP